MTTLHFYRCFDCLSVACTKEKLALSYIDGQMRHGVCGACGGYLEYLGQTQGDRLTRRELLCPCDGRCTNATGPSCDCRCGGENHGSHRLVETTISAGGIPTLNINPNAREIGESFRALLTRTWKVYRAKYGAVNQCKADGQWIDNWSFYMDGQRVAARIRRASELKTNLRIKKLTAIMVEVAA